MNTGLLLEHQAGLNGLLGSHSTAGNPLLGDILVVLAQLFAAAQFVGDPSLVLTLVSILAPLESHCPRTEQPFGLSMVHVCYRACHQSKSCAPCAVEEKFLMSYRVPALLAVGLEVGALQALQRQSADSHASAEPCMCLRHRLVSHLPLIPTSSVGRAFGA